MEKLVQVIENLKKTKAKELVDIKLKEFRNLMNKPNNDFFKELCFCILTANFNAKRGMEIHKKIGNGFLTLSRDKLAKKLKQVGYRFPNVRADYIVEARKFKNELGSRIRTCSDEKELRVWLVKNIKGIGLKEASHFLRNIGYRNCAILDFHIIDLLSDYNLIKKSKTLL